MPIITRLLASKKPGFVWVFVDDKRSVRISADELLRRGLDKGQQISPKTLASLSLTSQIEKLYFRALNLISYRSRSRKEISDRLKRLTDDTSLITKVLDRLEDQNFLSDRDFAQAFVNSRLRSRPKGPTALHYELQKKGIAKEIIEEVLRNAFQITSQADLARQFLEKKTSWRKLSPFEFKKKAFPALSRRGFSLDTIRQVIDELIKKE